MSRQTETRLAVVRALGECMRTEVIERVRVGHLCQVAGISRTTFYEYFQAIYAVPTWMWDYLMSQSLYLMGTKYGCREAHVRKFRLLRQHRDFFVSSFRWTGYTSVIQHGGRSITTLVSEMVELKRATPLTPTETLQVEFFMTGAKHMTDHWVERGMREEPGEMADLFCGFMPAFALPYLEPASGLVLPHDVTVPLE